MHIHPRHLGNSALRVAQRRQYHAMPTDLSLTLNWMEQEVFFQTVAMASPWCIKTAPNSLHWVAWDHSEKPKDTCQHGDHVDWCGQSPGLIQGKDTYNMVHKDDRLFARKFRNSIPTSRTTRDSIKAHLSKLTNDVNFVKAPRPTRIVDIDAKRPQAKAKKMKDNSHRKKYNLAAYHWKVEL